MARKQADAVDALHDQDRRLREECARTGAVINDAVDALRDANERMRGLQEALQWAMPLALERLEQIRVSRMTRPDCEIGAGTHHPGLYEGEYKISEQARRLTAPETRSEQS